MLTMRRRDLWTLAVLWLMCATPLFSQSNPTPHSLASGDYTFTSWASTSPAGTYPSNMIFHYHTSTPGLDPVYADQPDADWTSAYNLGSGARILGKDASGFSFLNTTTTSARVGAAVLGLNTQGRQNVQVTWTGGTVTSNTREYTIRLQYRVGSSGAWQDVLDAGNNPVQYVSNTSGHSATLGPVTLPSAVNNQPEVYLRWKYYYSGSATGGRPELRVDDITVTSDAASGTPTRLAITQITPASPSTGNTFSVTVQSHDNSGSPRNVTNATSFSLSRTSGTGTLGGNLTGTIPAGQSTVTVSGLTYNVAESGVQITATRTSGDALASGTSAPFTVQQSATQLAFVGAPTSGATNNPFNAFTVEARRPDNSVDPNYTGGITLSKVSGSGTLMGTLSRNPSSGVASFNDISVTQAGTYVIQASGPGVSSTSFTVTIAQAPVMTDLLIPQYMKSTVGSGQSTRVPAWALVRLDSLQPNTQYRYVVGHDVNVSSQSVGAGNNLHYNPDTGMYTYSTSKYFGSGPANNTNSSGFRTGPGQTSVTLWINNTASTNSNFNAGNNLYWVLTLADTNGNRLTRLVSGSTTRTVDFGTAANQATGIVNRSSNWTPKNFVALYDNEAGTGAPLSTAIIQEDGAFVAAAAPFYAEIDNDQGAWATIIPNTLPAGVRRIEQRSASGALLNAMTDADGVWNVSTVNPNTGINALYVGEIVSVFPGPDQILCRANAHTLRWNSFGVDTLSIELSANNGLTFTPIARVPASDMSYEWNIPAGTPEGNAYRLRFASIKAPFVADTSEVFAIAAAPEITMQPLSVVRCAGDTVILSVGATGTDLTYQWQRDGMDIPGANFPQLVIPNAQSSASGTYRVQISGVGTCAGATSQEAVVFINQPTRITMQPVTRSAVAGGSARFRVETEVIEPATYQWYRGNQALSDNSRIMGSTSSVLTINNVSQADVDSTYRVVVTGRCGVATSNSVSLTISTLAVSDINATANPCVGGVATITATVQTNPQTDDLVFSWTFNGVRLTNGGRISGANSRNLSISNISATDSGLYMFTVTDPNTGATATETVRLSNISTVPVITLAPQSQTICPGTRLNLTGSASQTNGLTFQWLRNGVPVPGATTAALSVDFVDTLAGRYSLVASNACGADTSDAATITARQSTLITQNLPSTVEVTSGGELRLSVTATGEGNVTYQWFKNGQAISNATSSTFRIPQTDASDAGQYYVVVTGECGPATSATSTVVVNPNSVHELVAINGFVLDQNSPNPFADVTTISYVLPYDAPVEIVITDVLGQTVRVLPLGIQGAGRRSVAVSTEQLSGGMYFYTLRAPGVALTRTLTVLK